MLSLRLVVPVAVPVVLLVALLCALGVGLRDLLWLPGELHPLVGWLVAKDSMLKH
jgi:hypothetical protein